MIDFQTVCTKVDAIFKRCGYPGIGEARDADNSWIISPAPENPGEVEYGGVGPCIVEKKTGKIRNLDFLDDDDWELIQTATPINVPKEFVPKYSI